MNFLRKPYSIFLLIFCIYIIFLAFVSRFFLFYHFSPQTLFILDLIGINFVFPVWVYYVFSTGCFFLFAFLSIQFFTLKYSVYAMLIYAITPWFVYMTVFQSFYIYLLFLVMFASCGLMLHINGKLNTGRLFFHIGILALIFSSLPAMIMCSVLLFVSWKAHLISFNMTKLAFFAVTLIIILSLLRQNAFKNIYQNQITLFSNPGLLAESNRLQGDSKKEDYIFLARLIENKYIYLAKFSVLKSMKQFVPSNFFSPQEKMLSFSFVPPIFLGFLLPCLYGVYKILNNTNLRRYFLVLTLLTAPSFLSQKMVDLNRLVLLAPFIVIVTIYGISLFKMEWRRLIIFAVLAIVSIQFLFTIADISLREDLRYHRYYGVNILDDFGHQ